MYTPQAADSDALTYTLGGPDADKFVINVDGSVSFVTAPDFEAPGSAAGANSYSFSVTASDGTLSDVQAVTVNVGDVTENVAPVIPTPTGGVVLDFEGYASNGDGTHNVPTDAFISYGYNEEPRLVLAMVWRRSRRSTVPLTGRCWWLRRLLTRGGGVVLPWCLSTLVRT